MAHALTRRTLLGAVAVACVAGGCARPAGPSVRARVNSGPLVIWKPPWPGWVEQVSQSWKASGTGFDILWADAGMCAQAPDLYPVTAGTVSGLSLTATSSAAGFDPYVKANNFDRSILTAPLVRAFSDTSGGLAGIPAAQGEVQFYVNPAGLDSQGVEAGHVWSWDDLRRAVTKSAATPAVPGIVGMGWADVRIWGAFVEGLGGTLFLPDGRFHLEGAVAPTSALVALARQARWEPVPTYRRGTPAGDFRRSVFRVPLRGRCSPLPSRGTCPPQGRRRLCRRRYLHAQAHVP